MIEHSFTPPSTYNTTKSQTNSNNHAANIKGDTISFIKGIKAFAKVVDVKKAEAWSVRMLESGVELNVITFNAVTASRVKVGDGRRPGEWLANMKVAVILPSSFPYSSAAKPHAAYGDHRRVEELTRDLRADGPPYDDFCLPSLLYTYINAKPKQREKAEATVHEL